MYEDQKHHRRIRPTDFGITYKMLTFVSVRNHSIAVLRSENI